MSSLQGAAPDGAITLKLLSLSFFFFPLLHDCTQTDCPHVSVRVTPHPECLCFPCFLNSTPPPPFSFSLPGTLMILKSACSYNASYIDRLISVFMRSLQKMVREHLSPQQANPGVTETSTGKCTDANSTFRSVFSPQLRRESLHQTSNRWSVCSLRSWRLFIHPCLLCFDTSV